MRLWHKDLIPYLPRKQLVAQWRECCAIARNIAVKGSPNHVLVNRIMDYPSIHFFVYSSEVISEMVSRGYKVSKRSRENFQKNYDRFNDGNLDACFIFHGWHDERYLVQCLANLQEKYDCGAISKQEWKVIVDHVISWRLRLSDIFLR